MGIGYKKLRAKAIAIRSYVCPSCLIDLAGPAVIHSSRLSLIRWVPSSSVHVEFERTSPVQGEISTGHHWLTIMKSFQLMLMWLDWGCFTFGRVRSLRLRAGVFS